MPDAPIDVYSDSMGINLGPLGCSLVFSVTSAGPVIPGVQQQTEKVAVIRVSLEHVKMMAYIFRRQILEYERQSGTRISIPLDVLNQLRIGREDWDECWGEGRR